MQPDGQRDRLRDRMRDKPGTTRKTGLSVYGPMTSKENKERK